MESSPQTNGDWYLTDDILEDISKMSSSYKSIMNVRKEQGQKMHQGVLNTIAHLFQFVRDKLKSEDLDLVMKLSEVKMQSEYETPDLEATKFRLTSMANDLRSLQNKLLGPETNIYQSIKQSKDYISSLIKKESSAQSQHIEQCFSELEENFRRETDSLRTQLEILTKQSEALHLHVLNKEDYRVAMEHQTQLLIQAI